MIEFYLINPLDRSLTRTCSCLQEKLRRALEERNSATQQRDHVQSLLEEVINYHWFAFSFYSFCFDNGVPQKKMSPPPLTSQPGKEIFFFLLVLTVCPRLFEPTGQ